MSVYTCARANRISHLHEEQVNIALERKQTIHSKYCRVVSDTLSHGLEAIMGSTGAGKSAKMTRLESSGEERTRLNHIECCIYSRRYT